MWAAFCLLMLLVGLQERWYAGAPLWLWPLFYEASSLLVATALAARLWRRSLRGRPWLGRPASLVLARAARLTPLVALGFVALLLYLARCYAVRAAFGLDYLHQPWAEVLASSTRA